MQVITSLPALPETSTCPAGAPPACFVPLGVYMAFPLLTSGLLEAKPVSSHRSSFSSQRLPGAQEALGDGDEPRC